MIDRVGSPFRYRRKERKRYRRDAKREIMAAEKFEAEGIKQWAADLSRRMAELSLKMARTKRRKKKKSKNSN
jgi:hypothetical protein